MVNPNRRRKPPAKTPEQRENDMINLALDLAEEQLRQGTATSQVITHYLKLATTREKLEKEQIEQKNLLLRTQVESMESSQKIEAMYEEAIRAFRGYSGTDEYDED